MDHRQIHIRPLFADSMGCHHAFNRFAMQISLPLGELDAIAEIA